MPVVTKAEFARITGRGKSAVSNWIEKGTIRGDALVGTGRNAMIDVDKALVQLRGRDAGQTGGNGAATRVFRRAPAADEPAESEPAEDDVSELDGAVSADTQERIARERLGDRAAQPPGR